MTTIFLAIICSVFGIQLIYWLLMLRYEGTSVRVIAGQKQNIPAVSIIVCAHDEEKNLRELIPLLMEQDHPGLEVIIVNDRSNDGTYDYLLEQSKLLPRLKVVTVKALPNHVTGKKFALTLGIKAASHDIVLLTDADCRPASSQWARTIAGSFTEGIDLILGMSPYKARPGILNAFIRFETILTAIQYTSLANAGMPYMGVGRNLAYRKALFLSGKGFSRHMSVVGGDDDLFVNDHANGKNTLVCAEPSAIVYSEPKETLSAFFTQKVRHLSAGKKYRFTHQILLGIWSLSWIIFPVAVVLSGILYPWWISTGVSIIWAGLGSLSVHRMCLKSKTDYPVILTPVMMMIYPFYYAFFGITALLTKQLQWKR